MLNTKGKKDMALVFYKQVMKEMYKLKFVRKLKEKIKENKRLREEKREVTSTNGLSMEKLELQLVVYCAHSRKWR